MESVFPIPHGLDELGAIQIAFQQSSCFLVCSEVSLDFSPAFMVLSQFVERAEKESQSRRNRPVGRKKTGQTAINHTRIDRAVTGDHCQQATTIKSVKAMPASKIKTAMARLRQNPRKIRSRSSCASSRNTEGGFHKPPALVRQRFDASVRLGAVSKSGSIMSFAPAQEISRSTPTPRHGDGLIRISRMVSSVALARQWPCP